MGRILTLKFREREGTFVYDPEVGKYDTCYVVNKRG